MSARHRPPPLRVTHVVHAFEGGGLETLVAAMARGVDPDRVAASVISLSGNVGRLGTDLAGELAHMIAVRPLPVVSLVAPVGLARAIRRTRADVVHVHSGAWFKGALGARLAGTGAVVFTEHGREHDDPPLGRWTARQASRMTDVVVAVSDRLEHYLRERVGVATRRLRTIENGVNTDHFSAGPPSADARRAFDIPAGALVVGSVGRLETVKAYERLLHAAASVRARGQLEQPLYVLLCGEGSQRSALQSLAASLGLGDVVRFPGWIGDPIDAYRMMDVFVLPSLSEGLSVSLLEAMAVGAVPLVTPVGANQAVLGDALAAQVVSGEDSARFAEALATTLASAERRRTLAAAARAIVVNRFSQTRMIAAYTELYETLSRRPAPTASRH